MKTLLTLQPGDCVELIAPASRCSDQLLSDIKTRLESWQLRCIVEPDIFGNDFLFAHSDDMRFQALERAFKRKETKAIICARGGYGSMRLIPKLYDNSCREAIERLPPKLFVGMSDITALSLFLEKHWQWPTLHGALALDKFSDDSILALKNVMFEGTKNLQYSGVAMNAAARGEVGSKIGGLKGATTETDVIETSITGGNLCLVQTSIGTIWQMDPRNKIVFLEEVSERGYRVDRMLEHMRQANLFKDAAAIVFGDFVGGNEADGSSTVMPVLQRFADSMSIPVVQIVGLGHGNTSMPLPLGTKVRLQLGENVVLGC